MTMKRTYITPQTNIHHIMSSRILSGSGPGAGDQVNPGIGSGGSSRFLDDWDDDDTTDNDM